MITKLDQKQQPTAKDQCPTCSGGGRMYDRWSANRKLNEVPVPLAVRLLLSKNGRTSGVKTIHAGLRDPSC